MANQNWRLPEGVEEFLPPQAWALEQLRRRVLDVFNAWGFDYVEPPLVEYLDALLVGTGSLGHENDLDLQTLKVVDQRSGRMLGVRADMTAQAVRIDAHSLATVADEVRRLCYAGPVVLANPAGPLASRVPIKAGAEIFGSANLAADAEVVALMVEVLEAAGVAAPVVVLGHMGVYSGLVEPFGLDAVVEQQLFAAVQSKSESDIGQLLEGCGDASLLQQLPTMMGGPEVLPVAVRVLQDAPAAARESVAALQMLCELVAERCPGLEVRIDLAELAGYGYHNGPIFSAYQASQGQAVARGGRYDGIGSAFGRGRAATGFDVSLAQLLEDGAPQGAIWAPWPEAEAREALGARVSELRAAGQRVIASLGGADAATAACDRELVSLDGAWQVRNINTNQRD